jgi:hypothetical protein
MSMSYYTKPVEHKIIHQLLVVKKEKKIRIDVELIKQKQIFDPPHVGLQC